MGDQICRGMPRLGFIGFGEVTSYMLRGLQREGADELCVLTRAANPSSREEAASLGAALTESWEELFASSDVVFSAVRGHVALETASKAAEHITRGQFYADLNNAGPAVKREAALLISAKGATFIDVGLMGLPIQQEHKALMYVSGEGAADFQRYMEPFGMNIRLTPGEIGQAAKIKALVNIYMKCIQGVCLELAIGAGRAGVELADLEQLIVTPLKEIPREKDVGFWMTRGALLAERKGAEMQDVVNMFVELQVDPIMLTAAIERMQRVASFKLQEEFDAAIPYKAYERIIRRMFEIGEEKGMAVR